MGLSVKVVTEVILGEVGFLDRSHDRLACLWLAAEG